MPNSIRNYIDFNIKPCHQSHSPIFFPFGQEASLAPKNSVDSYLSRIISLLTHSANYIFESLSFPLRYEPPLRRPCLPHCPAVAEYPKRHNQPFVQAQGWLCLFVSMRHRGFVLRSASVVAKQAPPAPCNPANYVVRASYLPCFIQKNATPKSDVFLNETSGISPRGSNPSLFLNVKRAVFIGPRLFSH